MLRNCANVILARNHNRDNPPPTVSSRWTQRFLDCHPEYFVQKQKATDPKRKVANNAKSIEEWFKDFHSTYLEKGIQPSDCWNMDKLGFQMGMGRNQKIITKDIRQQSYIGSASNHELVTVVEAISGSGKAIPPQVSKLATRHRYLADDNDQHIYYQIILSGKIHQECWYTRTSLEHDALVSVSDSGFSNNQLSYEWIKHFEIHSAKSQTSAYRLLLLDGYGSHCTYKFLDHCEKHNIVLFCLPPHATHLLQPLDVVVFQPYKHWHAEAVDAAACTGCVDFNKVKFLEALRSIHQKALKSSTILSAFRETGLILYRPKKVVDRLQEKERERQRDTELRQPATPPAPRPQATEPTFTTPLAICMFKQWLSNYMDPETPSYPEDLRKIAKVSVVFATENIILKNKLSHTRVAEIAQSTHQKPSW